MNVLDNEKAGKFYTESLQILKETKVPFMVGGTFAVNAYLGLDRPTKDMDLFCKAQDYPKIMQRFSEKGYKTQITDERWLAKIIKGSFFIDLVFNSANVVMPITEDWFKKTKTVKIYNIETKVPAVTELIWSRAFVQIRHKFEGNDVAHLILRKHRVIDWKKLLSYFDKYWEVLFMHVLRFRFIYPSEREIVPRWLIDELLSRLSVQLTLPTSKEKVCHGRMLAPEDFEIDVRQWGFTDLSGFKYTEK